MIAYFTEYAWWIWFWLSHCHWSCKPQVLCLERCCLLLSASIDRNISVSVTVKQLLKYNFTSQDYYSSNWPKFTVKDHCWRMLYTLTLLLSNEYLNLDFCTPQSCVRHALYMATIWIINVKISKRSDFLHFLHRVGYYHPVKEITSSPSSRSCQKGGVLWRDLVVEGTC